MRIKIEDRFVGDGFPTYIVAEADLEISFMVLPDKEIIKPLPQLIP